MCRVYHFEICLQGDHNFKNILGLKIKPTVIEPGTIKIFLAATTSKQGGFSYWVG